MKDQDIANYISIASEQLHQVSVEIGGWPEVLFLPEPKNDAEREGLRLFVAELNAAGIKVPVQLCGN